VNKRTTRGRLHSKKLPASAHKPSRPLTSRQVESFGDELLAFHRLFRHVFPRQEQRHWSAVYLCGQLSNLGRKTMEPIILALQGADPNAVRALQQFIGQGTWKAQFLVLEQQGRIAEWLGDSQGIVIVDGSGFPKQGDDSVGVARQYCGHLGKVANCQEGVFLVYGSPHGYAFLDCRLYVHADWFAKDHQERWQKCGIPKDLPFHTEPELATEMLQGLVERDVLPFRWVACDEHFGQNPAFLDRVAALGKWYFAAVPENTRIWLHTPSIEPPGPSLRGPARTRPRVALHAARPLAVRDLVVRLSKSEWKRCTIQQGSKGPVVADLVIRRVTTVRDELPGERVWLVIRRAVGDEPDLKFYVSNAPPTCAQRDLVRLSGWRWPIETLLEEGKGEVGMDHYETRTWVGWYHHMAHTFLAHLFLVRLLLQFKKKRCANDGSSASIGGQCFGGRSPGSDQDDQNYGLSPTSQLRRLPFTLQTYTQAPPPLLNYLGVN
jgi:SRSO17 transposase